MHARQPVLCCKREQDRGIPATLPWLRPVVTAESSCWSEHLAGWRAETMPIVAWVASAAWSSCKSLGHTAYVLCFGAKKKQSTRGFSSGGLRWICGWFRGGGSPLRIAGHIFVRTAFVIPDRSSWMPFLSRGFQKERDHYSTNFQATRRIEKTKISDGAITEQLQLTHSIHTAEHQDTDNHILQQAQKKIKIIVLTSVSALNTLHPLNPPYSQ